MPDNNIDNTAITNELLQPGILSNEVQEIISNKPVWIVRNGILFFLIIFCCLFSLTFFISYPDIISAKARITSLNAPKEVLIKTDGKLVKLHAVEGKFVQQGQLLGFVESRANPYEVMMLSRIIDTLQQLLVMNNTEVTVKYLAQPYQNLGEVQPAYQIFMQGFTLFKQYLSAGYYIRRRAMLQKDMEYLQRQHATLLQQKNIYQQDIALEKETFDANSSLHSNKVISPFEYRNEKSKLLAKTMNLPQINAAIITNESSQHEKRKEAEQLENEIEQQKAVFTQVLNTLKVQLDDWKNKFILSAPIDGKIAFASFFQEGQQLKNGQTICFINPENTQYYAESYIPQNSFGKIRQGQKVLLKLASYPYQEFGTIEGQLDFISNIATDSGYLAKITLPNGLLSNYNVKAQYRDGLLAQSDIITADTKLSDRLFNSFRSLIK